MSDTFIQLREQHVQMLKHADRISGYIFLAQGETDPKRLELLHNLMQMESEEMSRDSDRIAELIGQFKKEKFEMLKNPLMAVLIVIIGVFFFVGIVSAQDAPLATNTAQSVEATATVAPVPTGEKPSTGTTVVEVQQPDASQTAINWVMVISALVVGLLGGGGSVLAVVSNLKNDKVTLAALAALEKSWPAEVQTLLKTATPILRDTADVLDTITAGSPTPPDQGQVG